ncbi:hypothetical protein QUF90_14425 [Desulfococcaceae bacterium HSG9]|nr:hypothetical protein [Desulfococcaceae bacterium HSG9]
MLDLWPPEIANERIKTPVMILREQASLLGEKSGNLVQGEVVGDNNNPKNLIYYFYVVAPTLGNYRYQLFALEHETITYPLKIHVEELILDEIRTNVKTDSKTDNFMEYEIIHVDNEAGLIETLKAIFRSNRTRRIITALMSQADVEWKPVEKKETTENVI